jgi:hypothetical protein
MLLRRMGCWRPQGQDGEGGGGEASSAVLSALSRSPSYLRRPQPRVRLGLQLDSRPCLSLEPGHLCNTPLCLPFGESAPVRTGEHKTHALRLHAEAAAVSVHQLLEARRLFYFEVDLRASGSCYAS